MKTPVTHLTRQALADAIIASPLRDIGKYRLITNGDFDPCDADVFLLDSLVLIDN